MAQVVYRANLSAASFPFLQEQQGRTVIVPQADNTYAPQLSAKEDNDKDRGIPQISYCHNVMPTPHGFQSLGYRLVINNNLNITRLDQQFIIKDVNNNQIELSRDLHTNSLYIRHPNTVAWVFLATYATAGNITVAYVSGVTYIFIQNIGCFTFDFSSNTLTPVTLTGLTVAEIIGVVEAFGYLIAYSKDAVAWSSTLDATDFVPSLITGAGGGSPEGAVGSITCVQKHTLGFIVYTTDNAVAAFYSSNPRYPFNFRAIVSSGGVSGLDMVAIDPNSGNHWAYTTSGVQLISMHQSTTKFPEVTDFLSGKVIEDFDEASKTFSRNTLVTAMQKKLAVISDRYLVFSYGAVELTHAIVYDLIQERWGKIKITHTCCYEFNTLSQTVTEAPRDSFAVMKADGSVYVLDLSTDSTINSGVLVLGKFQYIRQRLLQMDAVAVETVQDNSTFNLYDIPTLDGKNGVAVRGYALSASGGVRDYRFSCVGINHIIVAIGSFYLNSIVLSFNVHGRR